jgi:hypothetical protein
LSGGQRFYFELLPAFEKRAAVPDGGKHRDEQRRRGDEEENGAQRMRDEGREIAV